MNDLQAIVTSMGAFTGKSSRFHRHSWTCQNVEVAFGNNSEVNQQKVVVQL